jgi:hypothetical protein
MSKGVTDVVTVLLAIVGVAILAEILGSSNTSNVLKSFGSTLSAMFCTALSPITGKGCVPSVTSTINFGGL